MSALVRRRIAFTLNRSLKNYYQGVSGPGFNPSSFQNWSLFMYKVVKKKRLSEIVESRCTQIGIKINLGCAACSDIQLKNSLRKIFGWKNFTPIKYMLDIQRIWELNQIKRIKLFQVKIKKSGLFWRLKHPALIGMCWICSN